MRTSRSLARRFPALLAVSAALPSLLVTACTAGAPGDGQGAGKPALPPVHAGFDYQLGGAYAPPDGVDIVTRDHTASPAPGVYNVCYVNAFQAQPEKEEDWDPDLLLRDGADEVVMDEDWGEAVLDISTAAKRERIAEKVNGWIDECASKGFQAVEPDNYDSYTRAPGNLLSADDAKAFLTLLASHAHEKGLVIGQKNTAELASARKEVGLDFAVVEECGMYEECDDYVDAFGPHVMVVEYSERGLRTACDGWGDAISVVRRDVDLVAKGDPGYVRKTCEDG
ncbi:endo alpha-1,4 polygalactosaminidase [Streptomyces glaucus]|uniref:Endo alpha-1,4 polygalactosaminidase n=1 Tax=Streptomyces glaucus TaxID=284029 RepID=A0ABN3J874_9ACTN